MEKIVELNLLLDIDHIPYLLKISNVSITQQSILFTGVKQRKIFNNNSCKQSIKFWARKPAQEEHQQELVF